MLISAVLLQYQRRPVAVVSKHPFTPLLWPAKALTMCLACRASVTLCS